ncbi:MAG: C4-dicarboxylate ABC transporter [Betaproteobacteria bacterium]|nr:C4-dicarboxylate ABC transporter [Betaproteobacteria bacterium]
MGLSAQAQQALPAGYKAEYRMSTVVGTAFPWGKGGEIWANLVRERTQGRINIKMYPGVSLINGDQTREFTAIRQGVIDLAIGSSINWSPQVKELNLFSLPFLIKDYASLDALTGGEVGKDIFAILDKSGVVPLAWGENGFRELTNSKREINTPADLKGLKIRVVGSPLFIDMFTAMGANPVQMAKLHTVGQKNVTMWGYMIDPLVFVANKEIWNSWSAQDRDIVRQAAVDAGKQEIALARAGLVEAGRPLLKDIEALGVKVVVPTSSQREQFVTATRAVYNKWKPQIGVNLVAKAEKTLVSVK